MPLTAKTVAIPLLVEPPCSDDLALAAVSVHAAPVRIGVKDVLSIAVTLDTCLEVVDALAALQAVLTFPIPNVYVIDLLTGKPSIHGRTADENATDDQLSLLPAETGSAATACKHGLPRGSCETCRRERAAKQKKPKKERGISIAGLLELLWVWLQPPLDPETFTSVFPFPDGKKLDPYQVQGVEFLVGRRGALLADEMGLGKTAQAIVAARLLLRTAEVTRILVVAPKSLLTNWEKEWELWAQREVRVQVIDGLKERRQQQWEAPAHVWIVSYETLREDLPAVQRLQGFELAILDEAAKVKNPSARITRAVRDLPRARCWALTATPLENKPDDLVSILRLIAVTPLVESHVKNIEVALPRWEYWLTPEEREKLMQPIMLRRRQEDVLGLPPVVEEELWLELTPEQRGAYNAAYAEAQDTVRELGASVTKVHVLALLQKLKQLCNFDPKTDSSAKADFLVEHLREIAPEDKVLVFSQYTTKSLPILQKRLAQDGFQMLDIYGSKLSPKQRDNLLETFHEEPHFRMLLMGLKAGGVGLNLQIANHVVLFDHWWNPATHKQALGRVQRIGQEKPVFTTPLFTKNTVEQGIYQKLKRKEKLFQAYVDDPSEAQKEVEQNLTLEDLLEVLDLPLPEQRARQEKIDSRVRGNDGRAAQMDSGLRRSDRGSSAPHAPSWSGTWDKPRLRKLDPFAFEELVARLYEAMGFRADTTPASRDGGVDVIAESRATGAAQKLLIQCKHTNRVGVQVVRELAGVLSRTPDATSAVVVTSGTISKSALREIKSSRVQIVTGQRLLYLLERYPPTSLH